MWKRCSEKRGLPTTNWATLSLHILRYKIERQTVGNSSLRTVWGSRGQGVGAASEKTVWAIKCLTPERLPLPGQNNCSSWEPFYRKTASSPELSWGLFWLLNWDLIQYSSHIPKTCDKSDSRQTSKGSLGRLGRRRGVILAGLFSRHTCQFLIYR